MLELSGRTEGSAGGKCRNILRELYYAKPGSGEAGCISQRRLTSSCYFCSLPPWNSIVLCVFLSLIIVPFVIQRRCCYLDYTGQTKKEHEYGSLAKTGDMKRNVSLCRFVPNKSHIECKGIEFGSVRRDAFDQHELRHPATKD